MTAKQVIRILREDGWFKDRQKGSHIVMKRTDPDKTVVVPDHGSKDLGKGLLKAIEKQSGVKLT